MTPELVSARVTELEGKLTAANADVAALNGQIAGLRTRAETAEAAAATANTNLAAANRSLAATEKERDELRGKLTAAEKERDELKAADKNAEQRAAELVAKHGIRGGAAPAAAGGDKPKTLTERCLEARAAGKAAAAIILGLLLFAAPDSWAQSRNHTTYAFDMPVTVAAGTTTNFVTAVPLMADKGATVVTRFAGLSAAATNTVTINFAFSSDGVAAYTLPTFTWVVTAQGTNVVNLATNIPPTALSSAPYFVVTGLVTGATTGITNQTLVVHQGR